VELGVLAEDASPGLILPYLLRNTYDALSYFPPFDPAPLVLRRSVTRSPPRSSRCRSSCAARRPGTRAPRWPATLSCLDGRPPVYFCDPQSPGQRGSKENTNALLREYFPRDTDLARHDAEDLAAVAAALNSRPRKTLGWRTPAEALNEYPSRRTDTRHTPHQTLTKVWPRARQTGGGFGRHARGYHRSDPPSGEPARRQPRRPAQLSIVNAPAPVIPAPPTVHGTTHCCGDRLSLSW
jgi:hypothetical protein